MCVLCCFALFVCLTLLASFFLPSHLSFKNMYIYAYVIQLEEGWNKMAHMLRLSLLGGLVGESMHGYIQGEVKMENLIVGT